MVERKHILIQQSQKQLDLNCKYQLNIDVWKGSVGVGVYEQWTMNSNIIFF